MGECGHAYAFYSVARDNVGHVEQTAPVAQASIQVLPNNAPVLEPIEDQVLAVGQRWAWTNVVQEVDSDQQVTFSLAAGAPAGMFVDPVTGVLLWRPACAQGQPHLSGHRRGRG